MKTPSNATSLLRSAVLLALLFAAGSIVGPLLAVPLPAPVVGLAFVVAALRVGVMFAATRDARATFARPATGRAALQTARG